MTAAVHPAPAIDVLPFDDPAIPAAWRRLEGRWRPGLSCSWDWTETWVQHYGDLTRPRVVAVRHGDVIGGLALLVRGAGQHRGPVPVRTLHLGCAGEPPGRGVSTPYNRLLAGPAERSALARAVLVAADAERGWDELRLDDLDPADADAFLEADGTFAQRVETCRARDLVQAHAAGGVVAALPGKVRYQLRRSLRDHPPVEGHMAGSKAEALEMLDELVALHQASWTARGERGVFAEPRFLAFHRELAERLLARDALVLFRASAGRQTVGLVLGFVEHRRVLMYQGGFATFDDPRMKPGFITHAWCMDACARRGLVEYDLLAGDSEYKRQLTDRERHTTWLKRVRRTARTAGLELARSARRVLG